MQQLRSLIGKNCTVKIRHLEHSCLLKCVMQRVQMMQSKGRKDNNFLFTLLDWMGLISLDSYKWCLLIFEDFEMLFESTHLPCIQPFNPYVIRFCVAFISCDHTLQRLNSIKIKLNRYTLSILIWTEFFFELKLTTVLRGDRMFSHSLNTNGTLWDFI